MLWLIMSQTFHASSDATVPLPIARALRATRRPLLLSGAGISAESGIATFRGDGNSPAGAPLWSRFDPMQLATPQAFADDPGLVWAWYHWRMHLVQRARPNPGHVAVAAIARARPDLVIVTQNVDDLHERGLVEGGHPAAAQSVVHLHGRIMACRCSRCRQPAKVELGEATDAQIASPPERLQPPACQACGAPVRPGIVWFGESLPDDAYAAAVNAARRADLVLVVGTSGLVSPASGLPRIAAAEGAVVIEINPQRTALSEEVDLCWRTTAATGLPALAAALSV